MPRESPRFECKSLLVPLAVAALVLLNVVLIRQAVVHDAPAAPVVAAAQPLAHHPLPPPVRQAPPPPPVLPPPPPPPPPPVIVQAAPQIDIAALKRQTHHYDEFDEYDPANNPLHAFVANYHRGPVIDKWTWYFPIYHRYMRKFLDRRSINMMEVGVSGGGSLYMWKQYFEKIDHPSALLAKEDRQVRIVGIDIEPGTKTWERPDQNVFVRVGDQSNAAFLESVAQEFGPFDILVEDGGHSMRQMTVTFETMWKHIKPGGVYIAEDLHTCYWKDWEGSPPPHPETNFCRKALEMFHDLNSGHFKSFDPKEIRSFHAFDSVIVFEKAYPGELKPFNQLTRLTRGDGTRLP